PVSKMHDVPFFSSINVVNSYTMLRFRSYPTVGIGELVVLSVQLAGEKPIFFRSRNKKGHSLAGVAFSLELEASA
ncbi:MAG TPA: hypothetical protein PLM98_14705, partial [Thiolinea sp.]|nr:hypothetical protein [Thiolinea sp.]